MRRYRYDQSQSDDAAMHRFCVSTKYPERIFLILFSLAIGEINDDDCCVLWYVYVYAYLVAKPMRPHKVENHINVYNVIG